MATFTPPTCSNYLNIFTSERLACPNGIDNALSELQTMINETNIAATLEASFDKPLIVELILSGKLFQSSSILTSYSLYRIVRVYTYQKMDLRQVPRDIR